jgi:HD-GYP domain-containing protein (c-di-GMP phosphodiesterase class II)
VTLRGPAAHIHLPTHTSDGDSEATVSAWALLDRLGQALQRCTSPDELVGPALEHVQEGLDADVAFWYGPASGEVRLAGTYPLTPTQARPILDALWKMAPAGKKWLRPFLDPGTKPSAVWPCSVAAVRLGRSPGVWLGALRFQLRRLFGPHDLAFLTLARRLLLNQRRQLRAVGRMEDTVAGLVRCLATAIDARDRFTWGHSERVARLAVRLGQQAGLPEGALHDLYLAGLLHDVGKVGLPDGLLRGTGGLTAEGQATLQRHALLGEQILAALEPLRHLGPAVRHHHERHDGTGYPDGLAGEEVPLLARILAVADAYEAVLADRPHRSHVTPEQAVRVIRMGSGEQWDPWVVDHFLACAHDLLLLCTRPPESPLFDDVLRSVRGRFGGIAEGEKG